MISRQFSYENEARALNCLIWSRVTLEKSRARTRFGSQVYPVQVAPQFNLRLPETILVRRTGAPISRRREDNISFCISLSIPTCRDTSCDNDQRSRWFVYLTRVRACVSVYFRDSQRINFQLYSARCDEISRFPTKLQLVLVCDSSSSLSSSARP